MKLLKAGCLSFKPLFEQYANFDPFTKVTIATACNQDLRMNLMETNTIATEPLYGWRLSPNQSKVAHEWLEYKDYQLRQALWNRLTVEEQDGWNLISGPDHPLHRSRIHHARNHGEHLILGIS